MNGSITLQPIIFGPISPIPNSLKLTPSVASITSLGASSQITTVATYPDGTTADVSPASTGTNYTTTNTAVAAISADGSIQAVSNGIAIITAYNEGTSGSTQIQIGIPPQITISSPLTGTTVTQGATIPIVATVTGGATVAAVSFSVNGRIEFTTVAAPFTYNFTVPTGTPNFTIGVSVSDVVGASATSATITLMAVPDPLTTVTGSVVDPGGSPVAGATVNCLGITGTTSATGSFSLANVPTARGNIVCFASASVNGSTLSGTSSATPPVPSSTTDVGQIALSTLSSRGTDFWMAFQNYPYGNGAQLFVLSENSANFTVTGGTLNVTGTATAQNPATIAIPNSLQITSNQTVQSLGIHLTSDSPVTATFFYPATFTNDTYLAIPTLLLGTQYQAVTLGGGGPAEFVIVASQDATKVTLVPSCASTTGTPANSTLNVTLNQGQTYQYLCSTDATGSQITSDKPVAVISGNGCVTLGSSACDIVSEMMFPINSALYGTDYYSAPLSNTAADLFRVIAASDGTTVVFDDGVSPQTYHLNKGKFQEITTKRPAHYTADKPISVVQFEENSATQNPVFGDPLSMQLLPTSTFRTTSRFYSPSGFAQGNFVTIVSPNSAIASVTLNDAPVNGFLPMPGGLYSYVVVKVVTAQSVVSASQPVGVYATGFTQYGSYGHPTTF